ncbi:MAG: hypothetical protein AAGC68_04390 [Verrucomicrobiota bacterium]
MNSLSLGFLYVCGLSWLLCEVCVAASDGNSMPLLLFVIGFTVMFAILGCLKISDRAVELAGPVFAILIGLSIALFGFGSIGESVIGGVIRIAGGAGMIVFGVISMGFAKKESTSH